MDISKNTDIKELKAMAFDQIAALETAQSNLRALNNRIAELSKEAPDEAQG